MLSKMMTQGFSLSSLKLANNALEDAHIFLISHALRNMPNLTELDLSGNNFEAPGAESLKEAIISHAVFKEKK